MFLNREPDTPLARFHLQYHETTIIYDSLDRRRERERERLGGGGWKEKESENSKEKEGTSSRIQFFVGSILKVLGRNRQGYFKLFRKYYDAL